MPRQWKLLFRNGWGQCHDCSDGSHMRSRLPASFPTAKRDRPALCCSSINVLRDGCRRDRSCPVGSGVRMACRTMDRNRRGHRRYCGDGSTSPHIPTITLIATYRLQTTAIMRPSLRGSPLMAWLSVPAADDGRRQIAFDFFAFWE